MGNIVNILIFHSNITLDHTMTKQAQWVNVQRNKLIAESKMSAGCNTLNQPNYFDIPTVSENSISLYVMTLHVADTNSLAIDSVNYTYYILYTIVLLL